MNAINPANATNIEYQKMLVSGITDSKSLLQYMATVLDAEFQTGVTTHTNVDITPPAGSLSFADVVGCDLENNWRIARDVKAYWAQTITPTGTPESCDDIETVVNDVSKIVAPIATKLTNLYQGDIESPYFFKFFDIIITEVKTIIWDVHESDSDCGTDFVVNVT